MTFLEAFKSFLARIFAQNPEDARKRGELKRIHAKLAEIRPPYFKTKQNYVLPGFAWAVHAFVTLLRPLAELVRATVAAPDARVVQRYFDLLIESRLPHEARERRASFAYDAMAERMRASLDPEREIDAIAGEFQAFLREIESLGPRAVNAELSEVDRFIDICRHDYERLLGLFDPGAAPDSADWRPDFQSAEGEQVLPELIDLRYVLDGFVFTETLKANLIVLLDRRSRLGVDAAKRAKLDKVFAQIQKTLDGRLDPRLLLLLARAASGDPDLSPAEPRERREFFESYKRRVALQFEKDTDRLRRERHESSIAADIKSLFGEAEILEIEGYDDETDALLRRESPHSLGWIKPLRILKTFFTAVFERYLRDNAKRILVEGYFDNKAFQNNLANVIYQCERSSGRIVDFETQMTGNGRISTVAMRRYVEELRRGKDIAVFLERLVDAINGRAAEIVEDEVALLAMLGDSLGDILTDYRRASPDLVTNIRTLGGGRNREIIAQVHAGREQILVLVKIMRNFTVIKPVASSVAGPPASREPRPAAASVPPAGSAGFEAEPAGGVPDAVDTDSSGLEEL